MIRLLPFADTPEMRWKNGQGVTREVCRYPDAEHYDWRVSVATIRDAGAFSRFPGYLRNISVLEGEGMYLTLDGTRSAFIPPFDATDFNGNSDVFCDIVGGPLLDFNVIYHADRVRASVSWTRGGEWTPERGTLLLFNAGDALTVSTGAEQVTLQHYDSLLIDAPATVSVPSSPDTRLACVTLSAR